MVQLGQNVDPTHRFFSKRAVRRERVEPSLRLQSKNVRETYADQRRERNGERQEDEDHPDQARQPPAEVELSLG